MRRRNFFWLILGITLLVPFLLMVFMASFSITEFAIISGVIIVVALTLLGRTLFSGAREGVTSFEQELTQHASRPALVIGLGVLALALVGTVLTLSLMSMNNATTAIAQTPAATSIAPQPVTPREVNTVGGLVGPLVGAVVGAGLMLAAFLYFSRREPARPAAEEPPIEVPTLDWREMLGPDDESGDDSDVGWWVQQLSNDDPKR